MLLYPQPTVITEKRTQFIIKRTSISHSTLTATTSIINATTTTTITTFINLIATTIPVAAPSFTT